MVDKELLRAQLAGAIERDRDTLVAAQQLTSSGVTHEDARSDGSKDMRATEASYIARGQAKRAQALAVDLARVQQMTLRAFSEGDPIALSALVTVRSESGVEQQHFLAPAGGGIVLRVGASEVRCITPASPVGRALLGRSTGDEVEVRRAGGPMALEVTSVR